MRDIEIADMEITAIVAVDNNWSIGRDGGLLAHIPGDLKFFKEKTLGGICIMGRKTFASLPAGPLPGRTNCVLTKNPDFGFEEKYCGQVITADSVSNMMSALSKILDTKKSEGAAPTGIFVIGGGMVYRVFMPYIKTCLVTKIDAAFEADTSFPNMDVNPDFKLTYESEPHMENGYGYRFCEYQKTTK